MELNIKQANPDDGVITALHMEAILSADQLDHADWEKAKPVAIVRKWSGEPTTSGRFTEARIVWSEESLTIRFVCPDAEPLLVNSNPQVEKKTLGLWHKDVFEIFIAPEAETPDRYFEFEAAPTGEWVDLAISFAPSGSVATGKRQTDSEFHSGMTAAASIANGWTSVAICIPWSDAIPKPRRGDDWRVNLFRCVGTGDDRYLAWLPTHTAEPNFHVPEAFGRLRFR
jgi:alpha-galactosidase